jgi:hypothetical protein
VVSARGAFTCYTTGPGEPNLSPTFSRKYAYLWCKSAFLSLPQNKSAHLAQALDVPETVTFDDARAILTPYNESGRVDYYNEKRPTCLVSHSHAASHDSGETRDTGPILPREYEYTLDFPAGRTHPLESDKLSSVETQNKNAHRAPPLLHTFVEGSSRYRGVGPSFSKSSPTSPHPESYPRNNERESYHTPLASRIGIQDDAGSYASRVIALVVSCVL